MKSAARYLSVAMLCVAVWVSRVPIAAQPAIMDLGTLGGPFSSASAINNRDQVVGVSNTDLVTFHAFRWASGRTFQRRERHQRQGTDRRHQRQCRVRIARCPLG